jgi:hypothetical protein
LPALEAETVPQVPEVGLLTHPLRTARPLRLLFGLVNALYGWGLGGLTGHRFLQLTHRGRRSKRLYRTVLEVIAFEPLTCESVVLSAWGERADWYRNIRATPAAEIRTACERYINRAALP